jgi:hypothetical protein
MELEDTLKELKLASKQPEVCSSPTDYALIHKTIRIGEKILRLEAIVDRTRGEWAKCIIEINRVVGERQNGRA